MVAFAALLHLADVRVRGGGGHATRQPTLSELLLAEQKRTLVLNNACSVLPFIAPICLDILQALQVPIMARERHAQCTATNGALSCVRQLAAISVTTLSASPAHRPSPPTCWTAMRPPATPTPPSP